MHPPLRSLVGPAFSPVDVPGMVAWYRQGIGLTDAGSGACSSWADQSGNANHLLQGTGTNRPTIQADGSLLFDGVDNFMKTAAFTLNQPASIYMVAKQVTWTDGDFFYDGNTDASAVLFQSGSTPSVTLYAGGVGVANTGLVLDTYAVISMVMYGALSVLKINNAAAQTGNTGPAAFGGFTLGSIASGASNWANIQVKEIIIRNRQDNDRIRDQFIRYLAKQHGVAV